MEKPLGSHATQHELALRDPITRKLLQKLKTEYEDLSLVERGERLKGLKNRHCTERGLARALDVDPGTIRRDLRIAELSPEDRTKIAQGASATAFLRRKRNLDQGGVANRCRQPKTTNPHSSSVNSIHKSKLQPGIDVKLTALEQQVELLIDGVGKLVECVSSIGKCQDGTGRILGQVTDMLHDVMSSIPVRAEDGRITTLWAERHLEFQRNTLTGAAA